MYGFSLQPLFTSDAFNNKFENKLVLKDIFRLCTKKYILKVFYQHLLSIKITSANKRILLLISDV